MSELKLYRAKLKTRSRIMKEIPREQQGWWADVCAGKTLELREATDADIERCNLGPAAPRDPAEYLCENIEHGSLVSRIGIAELTEIPERGLIAHHNESMRLRARIEELEAELECRAQPSDKLDAEHKEAIRTALGKLVQAWQPVIASSETVHAKKVAEDEVWSAIDAAIRASNEAASQNGESDASSHSDPT